MFTVYSKPSCPQCERAKTLLDSHELEYRVIHLDVGQLPNRRAQYITRDELLAQFPGTKTMPLVLLHDQKIGGFTELQRFLTKEHREAV